MDREYFKTETLQLMRGERHAMKVACQRLFQQFATRRFEQSGAKEHASHGFARRLSLINFCVEKIFEILPPEREDIPERDLLLEVTIHIQAFIFNLFGCLDNLAWTWVHERKLEHAGKSIPPKWVGLLPSNRAVRDSFSSEFRDFLATRDAWFAHLENFRHALAHRIPLYIPPFTVHPVSAPAYQKFDDEMWAALVAGDLEEHDRLSTEQMKLARFRPWMQHSYGENAKPIVFHPQIVSDLKTLEEIGRNFLIELDR